MNTPDDIEKALDDQFADLQSPEAECMDCGGEGHVCYQCDLPESECDCDEEDIMPCDYCDGTGKVAV